jgi:hypothetical protein
MTILHVESYGYNYGAGSSTCVTIGPFLASLAFLFFFCKTSTSLGAKWLNRESCETQERSRRCNPDPDNGDKSLCCLYATVPTIWDGKAGRGRESQKTCL